MRNKFNANIIILTLLIGLLSINKCSANDQINKDLNLVKGYSYLLNFDDKVVRYSLGNNEAAAVELVSSIFNDKRDVLIKTLKETNTNLLIWTKDDIYNFNISIIPNKPSKNISVISEIKTNNSIITGSPIIQNFSKEDKRLPEKNKSDEMSLDAPPHLPHNQDVFGFEIDQPPKM